MKPIRLKPSDTAPDFSVVDVMGKTISLSDYRAQSVLLVFLRYSGCPWCNLTIHRLTLEYPMLHKQKCQVIAFIQSDAESIKKNIYERHAIKPQFPIIADAAKQFYKLYGVQSSRGAAFKSIKHIPQWAHAVRKHGFKQTEIDGDLFLVPATFLLAAQTQTIVKANYGTSFYEFDSLFSIYESLIFKEA
ncbi:MAG: redoxin domain-containing protein [Candidatus Saccharimonadales bacterium]